MAKVIRKAGPDKAAFENMIRVIDGRKARVGWFESAQYPSGTPVAYVAAIQEFGSAAQGIPPRPFMRPTVDARRVAWAALVARGARAALKGDAEPLTVLSLLGEQAAGDVKRTITKVTVPPLSPVTLVLRQWRKGGIPISGKSVGLAAALINEGVINPFSVTATGAKPLVETGLMLRTLTSVVE